MVRGGDGGQHVAAGAGVPQHQVPAEAPGGRAPRGRRGARDVAQACRRQEDEQEGEG